MTQHHACPLLVPWIVSIVVVVVTEVVMVVVAEERMVAWKRMIVRRVVTPMHSTRVCCTLIIERLLRGGYGTVPLHHHTRDLIWGIGEEASFPEVPKNIMARGRTCWSEDFREIIATAISTATEVEVAVS
ncbi:hypothetical protein E2C01_017204 [Portunus trituberculatus]|uniref:Uncharacterized protein n=1 Tax=Portunus trituberculatus TaxID=210409 RepID=A0A5B7DQZ6_PORTR|nr:hypothetical protein [Portunus trituberculatus]